MKVARVTERTKKKRSPLEAHSSAAPSPKTKTGAPAGMPLFLKRASGAVNQPELARQQSNDNLSQRINAASAGGSSLSPSVQSKLESGLHADLSNVRVHTDSEADHLARRVQARAFTTSHDIFFREGAYNPSSQEGMRTLAHEVAHTLQQAAGPVAGTPMPGGVRVSEPSDSFEQAADRVAAKVMTGTGQSQGVHSETAGEQLAPAQPRSASAAPASTPTIQRDFESIPAKGWGSTTDSLDDSHVWFSPHAYLLIGGKIVQSSWFPGSRVISFTIPEGTASGTASLYVNMGWFKDNWLANDEGTASVSLEVPFTVSEGNLTFGNPNMAASEMGDGASLLQPVASLVAGNSISLSPVISGVGSTSSGVSGSLGVGKTASKGNVNVGVGGGYTVSMPSGAAWNRTFTVDLNVVQPQAKIPDMISEMAVARFAVGSAQLEEGAQQFIAQWYLGLDSQMKSAVESGGVQLILRGHASTTKGVEANQKLSQRRVERVQEILRGLASSNAQFKTFALGEYEAMASGEQDNIENPDWRIVTIEIFFIRPSSSPKGH